jgi:adenine-specific DNA-methyltransferase
MTSVKKNRKARPSATRSQYLWRGDVKEFLDKLPHEPLFDLVLTSPPYNLGKSYERRRGLLEYLSEQQFIIEQIVSRLKNGGSICWQVGNFVENGEIQPLDIELHPIFRSLNLKLRNRIVWRFGHGLHNRRRFSGRYEVILWYTKGDDYTFHLDEVRVPSKYPGKRHYKGKRKGEYSSHPLGKNPEDVWDMNLDVWNIPNVKGNHIEKTEHPCQFPVGLCERLIAALTNPGELIFDPFAGVGSTGVAAALRGRRFWGCERVASYVRIAERRISAASRGILRHRAFDKPVYDHLGSPLSIAPDRVGLCATPHSKVMQDDTRLALP